MLTDEYTVVSAELNIAVHCVFILDADFFHLKQISTYLNMEILMYWKKLIRTSNMLVTFEWSLPRPCYEIKSLSINLSYQ